MPFQPSRAQKRLADAMTERRVDLKLSHRDVHSAIGWSTAKLSRFENTLSKLEPDDVRTLAEFYQMSFAETERLCAMAGDGLADVWWRRYERWLSASFVNFLGYENEASTVWTVQTTFVPGLLQTPDYIRHLVTGGPGQDADRADAEAEVRLKRQQRLDEPESLQVNALLGEPVLHWQFGGPAVLRDQLDHLRGLMDKPNVSIRVIPFDRATDIYPFDFFEYGEDGDAVAFSETQWGTPVHKSPLEIRQARREVDRLRSVALTDGETMGFIEQRIRECSDGTE